MALIICKECGKEYSNQSIRCPVCACPTKDKIRGFKSSKKTILIISTILILLLVGILFKSNIMHLFGYYNITYADVYLESSDVPGKEWKYEAIINDVNMELGEQISVHVPKGSTLPIEMRSTVHPGNTRINAADDLKIFLGLVNNYKNGDVIIQRQLWEWEGYNATVVYKFKIN